MSKSGVRNMKFNNPIGEKCLKYARYMCIIVFLVAVLLSIVTVLLLIGGRSEEILLVFKLFENTHSMKRNFLSMLERHDFNTLYILLLSLAAYISLLEFIKRKNFWHFRMTPLNPFASEISFRYTEFSILRY